MALHLSFLKLGIKCVLLVYIESVCLEGVFKWIRMGKRRDQTTTRGSIDKGLNFKNAILT